MSDTKPLPDFGVAQALADPTTACDLVRSTLNVEHLNAIQHINVAVCRAEEEYWQREVEETAERLRKVSW